MLNRCRFSIGAFLGCFRPERLLVRLLLPRAIPGCRAAGEDDAAAAAAVEDTIEPRTNLDLDLDLEEEAVVVEEQVGGFRGKLAFDAITSDDVWRYMLEFV